jgi:glucose-6-phosphate 1-dehydrogenase
MEPAASMGWSALHGVSVRQRHFRTIWNRRYIDHVQITVAETVGVEERGSYYDETGALRDMVPNHIFQLITLTAMEPPISFAADAVRDEQTKILRAVQPLTPEEVLSRTVRDQYGHGITGHEHMPAYRSEPRVVPDSGTETFVALKLLIDNWRWVDVPFYLRTGKRLSKRVTEVAIQFKRAPFMLFQDLRGALDAEPPRPAHSARRGHLAALRRQDPRPSGPVGVGEHGFSLCGLLRQHTQHWL